MIFIGLHGESQSGKSMLAGLLEKKFQVPTVRTSFSHFVREEIKNISIRDTNEILFELLFNCENNPERAQNLRNMVELCIRFEKENWNLEERPASNESRKIQQYWGQDFRRGQDEKHWIRKHFIEHFSSYDYSDFHKDTVMLEESVRQPNERDYIHALNGVVLSLKSLKAPTKTEEKNRSHSVEQIARSFTGDIIVDMAEYFNFTKDIDRDKFLDKLVKEIREIHQQRLDNNHSV